jgi:predicted negative regulator of RcsB-dependent stress response
VRPVTSLAILLALAASYASADTIVLKNGGRIVAAVVSEDGDRVTYETAAGQLSIPKSVVARIDRDNFSDVSASKASSEPPISAPQVDPIAGYEDVTRLAVHDKAVDFKYLARLESDARTGLAGPSAKAAAGHYAAAQFLISQGNTDGAIDHLREALAFSPDNTSLLLNLAILYLRNSQFTLALGPLEHARGVTPDSAPLAADIAKLMGWAYSGSNKPDRAIEEWKRAEQLRPDAEVERALEKAERDKSEEQDYREGETAHFSLKYYGGANPDLAREILRNLEDDFTDLESQLEYTPPEQIAVILYTEQAFADITRAPGWVGALNDGRLRIPVQGLTSVTPDLAHVLKHELTHSFVGQKTHGRAPTWVQEGIAQWMEGKRSGYAASALLQAASQGALPNLHSLEGSWMGMPSNTVAFAYPWSLAVIESVLQAGDMNDIDRLLDRIATSSSTEEAVRDTLHSDYSGIEQQALDYLRHEYMR